MTERKMTEFIDCPECGAGVTIITNPTECYKCKAKVFSIVKEGGASDSGPMAPDAPAAGHYARLPVQPIVLTQHMGFLDGNVVKYVARFRDKNGKEDLLKARAYLDALIEKEYGTDG